MPLNEKGSQIYLFTDKDLIDLHRKLTKDTLETLDYFQKNGIKSHITGFVAFYNDGHIHREILKFIGEEYLRPAGLPLLGREPCP